MDFKIGDVVVLKSGGPKMTVSEYPIKMIDGSENHAQVQCKWFNEDNHLTQSIFHVDELKK
ncbi:DUF2158 domain-containing protein [uncultured Alistipes sp.]|uniref:YodC family protein n=1 Tax=uncultured Alistipes sp. TaxID=538949 RepID=UPI00263A392A|nr:DUF2158 domain-containing protein [uncultured Alistipes sp.]